MGDLQGRLDMKSFTTFFTLFAISLLIGSGAARQSGKAGTSHSSSKSGNGQKSISQVSYSKQGLLIKQGHGKPLKPAVVKPHGRKPIPAQHPSSGKPVVVKPPGKKPIPSQNPSNKKPVIIKPFGKKPVPTQNTGGNKPIIGHPTSHHAPTSTGIPTPTKIPVNQNPPSTIATPYHPTPTITPAQPPSRQNEANSTGDAENSKQGNQYLNILTDNAKEVITDLGEHAITELTDLAKSIISNAIDEVNNKGDTPAQNPGEHAYNPNQESEEANTDSDEATAQEGDLADDADMSEETAENSIQVEADQSNTDDGDVAAQVSNADGSDKHSASESASESTYSDGEKPEDNEEPSSQTEGD